MVAIAVPNEYYIYKMFGKLFAIKFLKMYAKYNINVLEDMNKDKN